MVTILGNVILEQSYGFKYLIKTFLKMYVFLIYIYIYVYAPESLHCRQPY